MLWHACSTACDDHGFTLVEMSIVLVIVGLIMLTVLPALTSLRQQTARQATTANLKAITQSAANYAQAKGCLPCPTPANVIGTGFGHVRGDTAQSPLPCGNCAVAEGVVPYLSLGIAASTARDGWGHWITMRVDPALTAAFGVVPPFAPCTNNDVVNGVCTSADVGFSKKGMCKAGLSKTACAHVTVPDGSTADAALVLVSHGEKGFGSFVAGVTNYGRNGERLNLDALPACTGNAGFARCNADGDAQYYDAVLSLKQTDPYDDVLAYADRNTIISMFGNGACATEW